MQIHGYFRRIYTELLEHKGAYTNLHQQADHWQVNIFTRKCNN